MSDKVYVLKTEWKGHVGGTQVRKVPSQVFGSEIIYLVASPNTPSILIKESDIRDFPEIFEEFKQIPQPDKKECDDSVEIGDIFTHKKTGTEYRTSRITIYEDGTKITISQVSK